MALAGNLGVAQDTLAAIASSGQGLAVARAKLGTPAARAKAASEDFEAMFLNSMFQQMFTAVGNDGPLGGGTGVGVWRSFLTDEYAKSFAKAGGIGVAKEVYGTLLKLQEAKAR
jgi:Rod binding domain-containing protein